MAKEKISVTKKTCFVVMGFGKKTDFETGRVLDLDKSYKNIIKPAVQAAGLSCIRADEIVHSGVIDMPMYDQLLNADVVVADLSTSNKNALYELGVRHALRPFTTIIICEDSVKAFPFDINHIVIRQYHHLGEDIGYDEVMKFKGQLTKAVKEIFQKKPREKDSPVYTFLNDLLPPEVKKAQANVQESIAIANKQPENNKESGENKTSADTKAQTHSVLMQQVDDAQRRGNWLTAKTLLSAIRQMIKDETKKLQEAATVAVTLEQQEDPYLLQRLALATYKSELPNKLDALTEAKQVLTLLTPGTSNDTETLGLWGAIHKRLWDLTKEIKNLDEAVRAYERGFYIRNDYYNGINYAFLLNERATQQKDHAEAITDFVEARRVRKEVLQICDNWLANNSMPDKNKVPAKATTDYLNNWYWVKATKGEAYVGINENDKAKKELKEAYAKAPEKWMKESTEQQLGKLKLLLVNSPLKHVKGAEDDLDLSNKANSSPVKKVGISAELKAKIGEVTHSGKGVKSVKIPPERRVVKRQKNKKT